MNEANGDESAPRPFNLQSSSKKQTLDQLRNFNHNNKGHEQIHVSDVDNKVLGNVSFRNNGNQRDSVLYQVSGQNSKSSNMHAPAPAFSGVFNKSPELNLSAK